MLGTLFNSMSGLSAQMQKLEIAGHNLANLNTTGYKRQTASFSELLHQRMANRGLPVLQNGAAAPITGGSGTRLSSTGRVFEQGTIVATGRALDLAIQGPGFFRVTDPDGNVYFSRDGVMHVDGEGRIVNSRGYLVLEAGLPEIYSDLVIDEAGLITCKDETGEELEIGRLEISVFPNHAWLEEIGDNLYRLRETGAEPEELYPGSENAGILRQGHLESSNVDLTLEVQFMIEAQRAFELNARSLTTADQLWSITNNLSNR